MRLLASLRARLGDETGYSLVELVVAVALLAILMAGLSDMFTSAERANSDASARMTSQQNVRVAFDRIEYDARCASSASILSSGAGVHLAFPSQTIPCAHATGNITWCVSSGSLVRIVGSDCSTAGSTFVTSITSATPFSCYTIPGITSPLPQLKVLLSVNATTRNSDKTSATDYITMRNAASGGCS